MFIGLLSSIINASNHTKCVSLSNQKCMTQLILISLYPNKYSQGFHYYPFAVKLDRCVGSCKSCVGMIYLTKYVFQIFQIKQKI